MKNQEMKNRIRIASVSVMILAALSGCKQAPVAEEQPAETVQQSAEETPADTEAENSSQSEAGADAPEVQEDTEAGDTEPTEETSGDTQPALADGIYSAIFDTDSSMFHVNEACEGRGVLTVSEGEMVMHITMPSQNIVNLYFGLAEDAQKEGAQLIEPTVESVTYSDGMTEEVYAFDFPVPYLDETFDLALIGTKGVWYDHKVSVSDPVPEGASAEEISDGTYQIEVTLEGGSGRASITSPAELYIEDGAVSLKVEWSSPNYDYMIVDGTRYEPVNDGGNSVFIIPVADLDAPLSVIADTTAMSEPHEISYTISFGEPE